MRLSNGSSGFERKVRSPSKTLAIYEPSGLVIASSKPKKTKSWQRLVQVKSATLPKAGRRYYTRQYGRFPIKKLCGRPQDYLKGVPVEHSRSAESHQGPLVFVTPVAEDVHVRRSRALSRRCRTLRTIGPGCPRPGTRGRRDKSE